MKVDKEIILKLFDTTKAAQMLKANNITDFMEQCVPEEYRSMVELFTRKYIGRDMLPELKGIPNRLYCENNDLQSVKIPDNIKYIGSYVFSGSDVKQLEISKSVDSINEDAFKGSSINAVVFDDNPNLTLDLELFIGIPTLKTIKLSKFKGIQALSNQLADTNFILEMPKQIVEDIFNEDENHVSSVNFKVSDEVLDYLINGHIKPY